MRKKALFTIIELLIVIGIIAILASILLPALRRARETSYTARCSSNFKQITAAIFQYAGDYNDIYPETRFPDGYYWYYHLKSYGITYSPAGEITKYNSSYLTNCPRAFSTPYRYDDINLSYGGNYYLMNYQGARPYSRMGQVRKPAQLVMFTETACSTRVSGRSDALYDEWFYYGRRRHNGGCVYLFADGHTIFHKAPRALMGVDPEIVWSSSSFTKPRFYPVR